MFDKELLKAVQGKERWLVLFCTYIEITDECWLWTGTGGHGGVAVFGYKEKTVAAHKIAYNVAHSNKPDASVGEGNVIMHSCDNPMCVNPDHLGVGTHQDNTNDAMEKGRRLKKRYPIKLNYELAEEIRAKYEAGGVTQLKLAKQYNVTLRNMQALIARDIWKTPRAYKHFVFPVVYKKLL